MPPAPGPLIIRGVPLALAGGSHLVDQLARAMVVLRCVLVVLTCVYIGSCDLLVDFGSSNEDPNELFFECYVGPEFVEPQAGATFDFFNTLEDVEINNPRERMMEEGVRLLFSIDPSQEAYVRCSYAGDASNLLAIAGELVFSQPLHIHCNSSATLILSAI